MKIVNKETFLTLPVGTVYAEFDPISFGDICIKSENTGGNIFKDFYYQDLTQIAGESSTECIDSLFEAIEKGASIKFDLESEHRDGQYDDKQLYAVWEKQDVEQLIARLQQALIDSSQ